MPTSKKRVKKNYVEAEPITKNPLKSKFGKFMVVVLVFGFVGAAIVGLIITLVEAVQSL